MKNNILIISLALITLTLTSIPLKSQSLKLVSIDSLVERETIDEEVKAHYQLQNISSSEKSVLLNIKVKSISDGHQYQFCFGGVCKLPRTTDFYETTDVSMKPGEITGDDTYMVLLPFGATGTTSLEVTYYIKDSPNDKITFNITYKIGVTSAKEELSGLELEPVISPNPARDYAILKLNNFLNTSNYSVRIFDLSGKILTESFIPASQSEVKLDLANLSEGSYLVGIISENKSIISRKFQVIR
ncbi:MAG: hypothetical protein HW421_1362 [Ignavibacteria bacterium]|nr:hypothetical protein [Ignavibacteria bacterium]